MRNADYAKIVFAMAFLFCLGQSLPNLSDFEHYRQPFAQRNLVRMSAYDCSIFLPLGSWACKDSVTGSLRVGKRLHR